MHSRAAQRGDGGLLVPARDPVKLAEAMEWILADPTFAARFAPRNETERTWRIP